MKWKIELRGHTAIVELSDPVDGAFTGTITSSDYGVERLYDGVYENGTYSASADFNGIEANFTAQIDARKYLRGHVSAGWFFHADFVGAPCDE